MNKKIYIIEDFAFNCTKCDIEFFCKTNKELELKIRLHNKVFHKNVKHDNIKGTISTFETSEVKGGNLKTTKIVNSDMLDYKLE